ncbi:uncharacterized protein ACLA_053780 [Aspergillus clavatus NRRL 1]|uniref:Uncharacterized protein n=1 Tax=Aspergillus clavatus (strain ATCC 1007 / CBS 513.65 / DSM 816 / NCTC 3887 / NRRL 1 / QM 1276 / 107) TaxID=344612 RepID=A1C908_ASPCL|nr:uncharacterized protein ACLA_053780 [Aspergillus clavatus NRRL 1]EAW13332.1 conserved hypothetical protein [Aspergillus clavatus NRRL 1]
MGRPDNLRDVESHIDEDSSDDLTWVAVLKWFAITYACILVVLIGLCLRCPSLFETGLLSFLSLRGLKAPFYAYSPGTGYFDKPAGIEIVALVPFKHHEQTSILDCYLQRNLVFNHGFLDRVTFVSQTNDTRSLEWLTSTVEDTAAYRISTTQDALDQTHLNKETLFIWLDGDTVFLEDQTIPTIVKTKLDHPNSLAVAANVVNQAALAALHSHSGITLPYLPEIDATSAIAQLSPEETQDWHASKLPRWSGPNDFNIREGFPTPAHKHRWLLSDENQVERTPISASMYTTEGPSFGHWTVKAQQHYSFLHHLELDDIYHYKFPSWSNPAESVSRNLLCFWEADASAVQFHILENDSQIPFRSKESTGGHARDIIIDGKGLAAHYSSDGEAEGLESTDILQRYGAYAREMACLDTF